MKDPHDQGTSQAFIACAKGVPLIDQFDQGQDALVGQFYGQGEDRFGTPELSVANVVFGDGSASDAQHAFAVLASPTFERCWARTEDALNTQQGITVPIYASTVAQLPPPHLAGESTAFAINSRYEVLGSPANFQMAVTITQEGNFTVMFVSLAFGEPFPAATRVAVAGTVAARMRPPVSVVTITSVAVGNGSITVSWRLSSGGNKAHVTSYTVAATPAGNDRVPEPLSRAASMSVPGGESRARLTDLVADCHQVYSVTVTPFVGRSPQAPAMWVPPVRPSGVVAPEPPNQVVVVLDGVNESQPGFTMDPFKPTASGTPSYCPEALAAGGWAESNFRGSPNGPWSFFNKWNFDQVGDTGHGSDSTPRSLANGKPTHTFMLDAIAAEGAVVLPYSYSPDGGARLVSAGTHAGDPKFDFKAYSRCNATPGAGLPGCNNEGTGPTGNDNPLIAADVDNLNGELESIHNVWRGARITVVGHSQGGLIAFEWWRARSVYGQRFDVDGVTNLVSLDSPINGVCAGPGSPIVTPIGVSDGCAGPPSYPSYPDRRNYDATLLSRDNSEGDPFHFVGTYGDTVPIGPVGAYGPAGPQNLMHEVLYEYQSGCQDVGGNGPSSSGFTCPTPSPPDVVSSCPLLPDSPSWMVADQHYITKFCPGNVAYFDRVLGLDYLPASFVPPPRSEVFVSSASNGFASLSCTVNFVARAPSGASATIAGYKWLDSVGRLQDQVSGPKHDTMQMTASTLATNASFTLELVSTGTNGLDNYQTYTSTFGSGCVPPG